MKNLFLILLGLTLAACGIIHKDNVPPNPEPLPYLPPRFIDDPARPPIPASPSNVEEKAVDLSSLFYKHLGDEKYQFLSNRATRGNWATATGEKLHKTFGICADLALSAGNTFLLQLSAVRWGTEEDCSKFYENLDTISVSGTWSLEDDEISLSAKVVPFGYQPFVRTVAKVKRLSSTEASLLVMEEHFRLFPSTGAGRDVLPLKSTTMLLNMTTSKSDIGTFSR